MPPGGVCNGEFLRELFDGSALFASLFIILGFFLHVWATVKRLPPRARDRTAAEVGTLADLAQGNLPDESFNGPVLDTDAASPSAGVQQDLPRAPGDALSGAPSALDPELAGRIAELEEQVSRLVAREGRDQGLLGGDKKGRRAAAPRSMLERRLSRQSLSVLSKSTGSFMARNTMGLKKSAKPAPKRV
jgi:hypothetical protein